MEGVIDKIRKLPKYKVWHENGNEYVDESKIGEYYKACDVERILKTVSSDYEINLIPLLVKALLELDCKVNHKTFDNPNQVLEDGFEYLRKIGIWDLEPSMDKVKIA